MANRNFLGSRVYSGHAAPVQIDCNFIVDSSNANGLGIRSLKGPYVQNVFMHTSATPGAGNSAPNSSLPVVNPNPANGTIVVQLMDPYMRVFTEAHAISSPLSGSTIIPTGTNLTVGVAYTITALGAMTAADWIVLGVPSQVIPAVGVSFIAKAQGATSGGSSGVQITAATGSGVASIELVGNSSLTVAIEAAALIKQGYGGYIILQCRDYAGALVAPANGSTISLNFLLSNSSVTLQGE